MFSDRESLVNYLDEAQISEYEKLREESWDNIPLDNKIDAYIAPLTGGIVGLVFTTVTIRSCEPVDFTTVRKDFNGCSPIEALVLIFTFYLQWVCKHHWFQTRY